MNAAYQQEFSFESLRRSYDDWKQEQTGRRPTPGEFLESYVEYVYTCLLSEQANSVTITRNKKVTDALGDVYEIDVLYEFEIAGVPHRVAMECKDHARPVDRDEVAAFAMKIQRMPTTIGVFISRSGYQPAAADFIRHSSILALDGSDIPGFGQTIAARLSAVALPSEKAIGEPFWVLMHQKNGVVDGTLYCPSLADAIEEMNLDGKILPLFFAKSHADTYLEQLNEATVEAPKSEGFAVRGVRQGTLRYLTSVGGEASLAFALMHPIDQNGHTAWEAEVHSAAEIADTYLVKR